MSATLQVVSDPQEFKLTAQDRCDRCGSQAYVEATFGGGLSLLLCGHHGREHMGAISMKATAIRDESAQIPAV